MLGNALNVKQLTLKVKMLRPPNCYPTVGYSKLSKLKRFSDVLKRKATVHEKLFLSAFIPELKKTYPLCTPHFQYIMACGKNKNYILDIFVTIARVAIEIDGNHHKYNYIQKDKDSKRDWILQSMGIKVVRYKNYEVNENLTMIVKDTLGIIGRRLAR